MDLRLGIDSKEGYYFAPDHLEEGRKVLVEIPFPFEPAVWFQRKAMELPYEAKWIPQAEPTLLIGGRYDCICPFSLFRRDERFHRPNIELRYLENGGHFPWIEDPEGVVAAFDSFLPRLG